MSFTQMVAYHWYFCVVRRFDFIFIPMMLKSAMISLLQYQNVTNFSLVYVFLGNALRCKAFNFKAP